MKIYFVRHGHPDYEKDCLTPLGHKQAKVVAERLKDSGIEQIFASPKGRAIETAEHTAEILGLEISMCDFMREISWGSLDGEPILANGHPWHISDIFAAEGHTLLDRDWQNNEPYCKSEVTGSYSSVIEGLDALLLEFGYQREGEYYRVVGEKTDKTIAVFSHGGSSCAALSHIFNIPFPQLCGIMHPAFTSITVVELSDKVGELFCPRFLIMNDFRHIEDIEGERIYGN